MYVRRARLPSFVFAAIVLTGCLTWAEGFGRGETKEDGERKLGVVATASATADEPVVRRAADLAWPVRILVGGKPIDVDGFASPCVGDFDEDGKNDLLVGQLDYGRLRVYRNKGTNAGPEFDSFEWFTAGGRIAGVPSGCCTGFTPQLVDYDGDGRSDLVTGSFMEGLLFLFRRNQDGTFAEAEVLENKRGEVRIRDLASTTLRYNATVFVHDWDDDGDGDLLIGRRLCLLPNEGTHRQPLFGDAVPLTVQGEPIPTASTPPCVSDWDGDGRDDLVVGRKQGIVWYRNTGNRGRPELQPAQILVSAEDFGAPANVGPDAGRRQPSSRIYSVCIADFNGDGRLDLLLGDHYFVNRTLSDEQQAQYDEASRKQAAFWKEYTAIVDQRPEDETREARIDRIREALRKWDELSAFPSVGVQASQGRFERHGGVWLYERIVPGTDRKEPPDAETVGWISVRVTVTGGQEEKPLEGIVVTAGAGSNYPAKAHASTDARGIAQFRLPPAHYRFSFRSQREVPYVARPRYHTVTTDATAAEVVCNLKDACELVLRAVDSETGRGISGVKFDQSDYGGEIWEHLLTPANMGHNLDPTEKSYQTDVGGRFRCLVDPFDAFDYTVRSMPKGYKTVRREPAAHQKETPGGRVEYTFILHTTTGD